jgi:hypothetical protein
MAFPILRRSAGEVFSLFSRLLNVLLLGDAEWTLSARAHRDGWTRTERIIDALFWPLEGWGHCARWYAEEIERSRATLRAHDKRTQG